ncbi:MAG: hypothetical protein QXQ90_09860 [Desulfurococcaceae archaeon]
MSEKRIARYVLKIERPKEGEVYHTALKHIKFLAVKNFMDVTTCINDALNSTLEYFKRRQFNPVDLARLQRSFMEYAGGKDFMRSCMKYFKDYEEGKRRQFCENVLALIEFFFKQCCTYVEKKTRGVKSRLEINAQVVMVEES